MKGVKGKFLKKLKSIKPIGYLKQDRNLHLKASDGYVDFLPKISSFNLKTPFFSRENEKPQIIVQSCEKMKQEEPEIIDVEELMKDLEDEEEEMDLDDYNDNKENISPCSLKSKHQPENREFSVLETEVRGKTESKQSRVLQENGSIEARTDSDRKRKSHPSETDLSSFRRPDLNSGTLFDPNLLAAFEQVVKENARIAEEQRRARVEAESWQKREDIVVDEVENEDPLMLFQEICPPGGDGNVIFYTTSLRGIRKTFEDCNKIRFLLQSFKVLYSERDISMHKEYRDELWNHLGGKTLPPRLFVKGRYIGGAEEVVSLHEQGKLKKIFEGVPMDWTDGPCDGCGGMRFVLCFKCNGSHKVIAENEESNACPQCNENGLIVCPYCT